MIDWREGTPNHAVLCCLVFHDDDYEFGRWDGETWKICLTDEAGGCTWLSPEEPIKFYALLDKPNELRIWARGN